MKTFFVEKQFKGNYCCVHDLKLCVYLIYENKDESFNRRKTGLSD
jgi:hypothetical protein